jgi:sigma-B regulation protein RsbU (phosphoserine phosphatase)
MDTGAPAIQTSSGLSALSLQSLLESARLLNSALNRNELLSHLMRTVMGRLMVTRAAIAVEFDGEMRVELARGVAGLAPGNVFPETGDILAQFERILPIGAAGRRTGILALGPAMRKLSDEQEQLLFALLEIAATALDTTRAHEHTVRVNRSLDQRIQELRAILDLARGLAAQTEPEQIAHLLALTLAGRWTVRKHAVAAWREGHPAVIRKRGIALPEVDVMRALAAGLAEPAYTGASLPEEVRAAFAVDAGFVLFPIRTSEETVGIVICGPRPAGLDYSPNDLEFGAGLIAQAAVAFENAWRLAEILARRQIEQELSIAAGIQESLFPGKLPELDRVDLAARNRQARHVGGDYYDVLPLDGPSPVNRHLLCVADISGKGLPAALLMSTIQATLRATLGTQKNLSELAARVNSLLHASTPSNRFATGFLLSYDPPSGAATYVNAGHNDGIVLRRDGRVELLTTTGLPLGLFARADYEEASVELAPGDLLMLYSDGVTEADNLNEEDFGMDRVTAVLKECQDQPAAGIVDRMLREIDAFAGAAPQHDDITLMILKRMM